MPRYKITLEFDHPGDGQAIEEHSTTNAPHRWDWSAHLVPEATNIEVVIQEYPGPIMISHGTKHYAMGRG